MGELRHIVLYVHLVGFALLLGGSVAQYLTGKLRINPAMLWGAVTQVVTGLALAAPWGLAEGEEFSGAKLGVKLIVAVAVLVMVYVPRRRENIARGHFLAVIGLVLLNAAVALFWTS